MTSRSFHFVYSMSERNMHILYKKQHVFSAVHQLSSDYLYIIVPTRLTNKKKKLKSHYYKHINRYIKIY